MSSCDVIFTSCSGNKWILNILSGKCYIFAPLQKLCKFLTFIHSPFCVINLTYYERAIFFFRVACTLECVPSQK